MRLAAKPCFALSAFLLFLVTDVPGEDRSSWFILSTLSLLSLLEEEVLEYLLSPIDLLLPSSSSSSPSLEPSSSADEAFSPPEYPELSSWIFESCSFKLLLLCSVEGVIFREVA